MKEITILGVDYLPAIALAKQYRYTTDYIGQLCRAKKVEAQLVGRSWYVNPKSLEAHKKSRYVRQIFGENISNPDSKESFSRLEVEPVVSKKTVKMSGGTSNNYAKRIDWKPSKYEADAGDLFPTFRREIEPRKVAITLAESTEIAIKTSSKPTKMFAEDLPLVSLKGKLKISSLNIDYSAKEAEITSEVPVPRIIQTVDPVSKPIHLRLANKESLISPKFTQRVQNSSIPAAGAALSPLFITKGVLNEVEESNGIEFVEVTLIATSGLLVLCLLLLFFGESSIEASSVSYQSGIDFSAQSLAALVSLFPR